MVIAPKMDHSMKARFKCKDGFQIKGHPLVECSFGNWTGDVPKCEEGTFDNNVLIKKSLLRKIKIYFLYSCIIDQKNLQKIKIFRST
jgi:hypothetical protein